MIGISPEMDRVMPSSYWLAKELIDRFIVRGDVDVNTLAIFIEDFKSIFATTPDWRERIDKISLVK